MFGWPHYFDGFWLSQSETGWWRPFNLPLGVTLVMTTERGQWLPFWVSKMAGEEFRTIFWVALENWKQRHKPLPWQKKSGRWFREAEPGRSEPQAPASLIEVMSQLSAAPNSAGTGPLEFSPEGSGANQCVVGESRERHILSYQRGRYEFI